MTLLSILKFFFKERKQSSLSNKERSSKKYDVFLCKKSEDVNIAKEICTFLENNGLTCFLSERDCPYSGQPNYYQTIDEALDNSTNLVVICSNSSFLESRWVKHEWQSFSNELLSSKGKGNLITIISRSVSRNDLPYTLRNLELIFLDEYKDKILYYLMRDAEKIVPKLNQTLTCHKLSEAFSLGINIACHSLSFVSEYPEDRDIKEKLEKWELEETDWSAISSPNDVSEFLESFTSNFGKKWGQKYEDSLYLGSCYFFGSITYNSTKEWGIWGGKIKLQCMKLGLPEEVFTSIDKDMTSDDLILFRDLIKFRLEQIV